MKILYGIQGTGNGHLSRSEFIYQSLKKYTKNIDILISGDNYSLNPKLPPIKYRNKGISFVINNGKIDYLKTLANFDLYKSYIDQRKIPFKEYDLIISDFEPISAWSSVRYKIPSIHISHQASFICDHVPRPRYKNLIGEYVMKYFCPTNEYIGLHYKSYGPNISEPLISNYIKSCSVECRDYITVYLPWYEDKYLYNFFKDLNNLKFHIFSKETKYINHRSNCIFSPIDKIKFIDSLRFSYGVICNTGFQTTSEVLYLGKRLLTIPVKGQYEQDCNVAALKEFGVFSLKELNKSSREKVNFWLNSEPVKKEFKNNLEQLLNEKIKKIFD